MILDFLIEQSVRLGNSQVGEQSGWGGMKVAEKSRSSQPLNIFWSLAKLLVGSL